MSTHERPYTLIAELTYRCPLRCTYCSNPLDYARHGTLTTAEWGDVFRQAEELGVVQLHLTGGEPLLRPDLERLVEIAAALDLYTNLITSGVPLTPARLARLQARGLAAVQLSVQDATATASDRIAGATAFGRKRAVARWVKDAGLPLTLNVVLHRENIAHVEALVALAEECGADRLELANVQYLGWALVNRAALLPTAAQIDAARAVAAAARARLAGRMEVAFVLPDYHGGIPKPCMDGWGRRYLVVSPDGLALPCHAAHTIPGLAFERVTARPLAAIWDDSPGLAAFRGEAWMAEPCRSCIRRTLDFGGCRCQAYHLTGNAAATDPACALAPAHEVVHAARAAAEAAPPAPARYRGAAA